jgi:CubicO group peptidase (beta-lactamase class C family)
MAPFLRLGLSLAVACPALAAQAAADLAERVAAFDACFDAANRLSGVLIVARGDEVVLHRAYGWAHIGLGVRNELGMRIGVASINKTFTAIALARLVAEGKLAIVAVERSSALERSIPSRVPRGCEK